MQRNTFLAAAALVASVAVVTAPLSVRAAAGSGDLVKCRDHAAVYYIGDDAQRHVYTNENVFFSWHEDFSEVKNISCEDLATFPIGDLVPYQAGTRLVKIQSDDTVYIVEPNGVLRPIKDEAQAIALFGEDWATLVDDLPETAFPHFEVEVELEDGQVPDGTILTDEEGRLFRTDDDSAVEVDDIFDDNSKEFLRHYALSLEEWQNLFALSLILNEDLDSLSDITERLLGELEDVHVSEDHHVEFEDVKEVSEREGDAQEKIQAAEEEIARAEESIAQQQANGTDTTSAESSLEEAQAALADAQTHYDAGEFDLAEQSAKQAKSLANNAREDGSSDSSNDDSSDDSSDDQTGDNSGSSSDDSSGSGSDDNSGSSSDDNSGSNDSNDSSGSSDDSSGSSSDSGSDLSGHDGSDDN